jgi:hypothetical protein
MLFPLIIVRLARCKNPCKLFFFLFFTIWFNKFAFATMTIFPIGSIFTYKREAFSASIPITVPATIHCRSLYDIGITNITSIIWNWCSILSQGMKFGTYFITPLYFFLLILYFNFLFFLLSLFLFLLFLFFLLRFFVFWWFIFLISLSTLSNFLFFFFLLSNNINWLLLFYINFFLNLYLNLRFSLLFNFLFIIE